MPSLGLTARLIAVLVAAVLFAGAAAIGLWTQDHTQRREAALRAQVHLVLQDLAAALETRLAIGLPLAQLPDVDRLLDAARLQLPDSRALAVLDDRGRALFSTDPLEVGDPLLDAASVGAPAGGGRIGERDALFWRPAFSDDGAIAGAALLRLPAETSNEGVTVFALALTVRMAPALAILCALAALLGYGLARHVGRPLTEAATALAELERHPTAPPAPPARAAALSGLPLTEFAAALRVRHQRLAQVEDELGRCDEMA